MKKIWIVVITFIATTLFWLFVLIAYSLSLVVEGQQKWRESVASEWTTEEDCPQNEDYEVCTANAADEEDPSPSMEDGL